MKRMLIFLLVALMLAGCTVTEPTESTTEPTVTTESTQETLPVGLYEAGSTLEQQTAGAVWVYPLADACESIWLLKNQVVLQHPGPQTRLDLYTGEKLYLQTSVSRNPQMGANGTGVQVTQTGMSYYNAGTLVLLNNQLQEMQMLSLTEALQGNPVLDETMTTAYYCTAEGIRALDLETGISRMLRIQESRSITLIQTCFDGELLVCVTPGETETVTEFIQVSNGQSVGRDTALVAVATAGDRYFLIRNPEGELVYQFGRRDGAMQQFTPENPDAQVLPALGMGGVVTMSATQTGTVLDYYDLDSGLRTASVTLDGLWDLQTVTVDNRGYLWFLTDTNTLCRWELRKSPVQDEMVYTNPWYTSDAPDVEGLALCQSEAERLSKQYGLEIHIWQDALEGPWADLTPEYRVNIYQQYLAELETVLSLFHGDILEDMGSLCKSNRISLSLVADAGYEGGQQEWENGNAYIAVEMGDTFRENLLRMLYRVMDSYVLSETSMLDSWRAEKPAEDRANLFVEALTAENGEFFANASNQQNLRTLCRAIRRAFGMRKYDQMLPWEQYLNDPLY